MVHAAALRIAADSTIEPALTQESATQISALGTRSTFLSDPGLYPAALERVAAVYKDRV